MMIFGSVRQAQNAAIRILERKAKRAGADEAQIRKFMLSFMQGRFVSTQSRTPLKKGCHLSCHGSKKTKNPTLGAFVNPCKTDVFMAGAPGFEPGTYGFGDRRSTN